MPLKFYNTLSREKEVFIPINPPNIPVPHPCGPTVYDYAHIGNLLARIFCRGRYILQKTLSMKNIKLKRVMNMTDIGLSYNKRCRLWRR